jgi:hypothetical protein
MIYSDRQRHGYTPPPCPVCGGPTSQHWIDVANIDTDVEDPDAPQWAPGTTQCIAMCAPMLGTVTPTRYRDNCE